MTTPTCRTARLPFVRPRHVIAALRRGLLRLRARVPAGVAWRVATVLCLPFVLAACGGGGSKASAPMQVTATAGDSSVTLTFQGEPGVEYWVFLAPDPSISTGNFVNVPGSRVIRGVSSPTVIGGLVNGVTYYFTINGRRDGGPGGEGTPQVSATPRPAGNVWVAGTPLGTGDLNAVGFGLGAGYVSVGAGGQVYSSADALTWTARASGVTTDLNGVTYLNGSYVAVGNGGVTLRSVDAIAWTVTTVGTQNLLAIVRQGSAFAAVGAGGTIVSSADAQTWVTQTSGTTATLRGIAFGNGTYVAVGDGGTVLTSTDLITWKPQTSGVPATLRSVTYGLARFVAVGDAGTIVTSTDGITWAAAANPTTETLNAVTVGSQFVAAGVNGRIVTSADGLTWVAASSNTTATLKGLGSAGTSYAAVGVAGTNLSSY